MLNLYRFMLDNGMKKLEEVPEPYQRMLKEEGYKFSYETNIPEVPEEETP